MMLLVAIAMVRGGYLGLDRQGDLEDGNFQLSINLSFAQVSSTPQENTDSVVL